ncbi:GAF domain-containing protein [Actinomadura sp. GC306]|uniref:GAF domain-containing sensor histidine kinase n=1 Tax=Actinomadura sp. GC306 TaxID=2530367 RepID=UPI001404BCCE|nr:GAF domain-containing protein [Actinomadura sp. GC306]
MTSQPQSPPRSPATLVAKVTALNEIADELAGEFDPSAALESILARCIRLMACDAGSVSSVDEAAWTYRKVADIGVQCQSGQVFPLDEGMTGEVVRRRTAVWFDRYDDVRGGHLDAADRDGLGATIGVPLEWRGRVIGACVLFSRDPHRRFGHDDAQLLGMFARHAAVALANATMHAAIEEHTRHRAAAAERQRVLAELGDLLAQAFREAVHEIDAAEERKPADAGGELESVRAAVQAAFSGITAKVHELAFVAEDERDLDTLLRSELATLEDIRSLPTELVVSGEPVALEPAVLRDIMRVLREVLDNIVRHASARSVRVLLAYAARTCRTPA